MANTAKKSITSHSRGPSSSETPRAAWLVTGWPGKLDDDDRSYYVFYDGEGLPNTAIFAGAKLTYRLSSFGWPWTDSHETTAYIYWPGMGKSSVTLSGHTLNNV